MVSSALVLLLWMYSKCGVAGGGDLQQLGCFQGVCYYLKTGEHTWQDAKTLCEENDMNMVMPKERNRVQYLKNKTGSLMNKCGWLGGKSVNTAEWRWTNGKLYNLEFGPIDNITDLRMCGYMIKQGPRYELRVGCHSRKQWICRNRGCVLGLPNCNIIPEETDTWYHAYQSCRENSMDLFMPLADDKMAWPQTPDGEYWIGLSDTRWEWVDGSSVEYFEWEDSQPSSHTQLCICIQHNGMWDDFDCSSKNHVLCETHLLSSTTATTSGALTLPPKESEIKDKVFTEKLLIILIGAILLLMVTVLVTFSALYIKRKQANPSKNNKYDEIIIENNTHQDNNGVYEEIYPENLATCAEGPGGQHCKGLSEESNTYREADPKRYDKGMNYSPVVKTTDIYDDEDITIVENDVYNEQPVIIV